MKKIFFNQQGDRVVLTTPETNVLMLPYQKEEIMAGTGNPMLYTWQNAGKYSNQNKNVENLIKYGTDPAFIQEDGYNPYFNVDQFGNIALAGANHGLVNCYDPDEIYGVKYNPDEQWYEQYDRNGNLVDYDYGSYTENVKDVIANLVKSGRTDFMSWHEDLPDGDFIVKGRLPMMFNRTFIRTRNPDMKFYKPKKHKIATINKTQKDKTGPKFNDVCYDDATLPQKVMAVIRDGVNPLNPPSVIRVRNYRIKK